MHPDFPPLPLVPDDPADLIHVSKPYIIAIRRDQMPEDIRSAFLPGDIILFHEPSRSLRRLRARRTQPQARGETLLQGPPCPWCKADELYTGLLLSVATLLCLGAAFAQDGGAYAIETLKSSLAVLVISPVFLMLDLVFARRCGPEAKGGVASRRRPPKCARPHRVSGLASRVLGPDTLVLLQQPKLNALSFWRYYRFCSDGQAGGLSDQELDSCIRHQLEVPEGSVFLDGLIGKGPRALLGLEPCQGNATGFWCGFSWPADFYRSYREWKRWRLAAVLCRRLQVPEDGLLQRGFMDGHIALEGLGCRGHKWLLVDPRVFSSMAPSRPRAAQ